VHLRLAAFFQQLAIRALRGALLLLGVGLGELACVLVCWAFSSAWVAPPSSRTPRLGGRDCFFASSRGAAESALAGGPRRDRLDGS